MAWASTTWRQKIVRPSFDGILDLEGVLILDAQAQVNELTRVWSAISQDEGEVGVASRSVYQEVVSEGARFEWPGDPPLLDPPTCAKMLSHISHSLLGQTVSGMLIWGWLGCLSVSVCVAPMRDGSLQENGRQYGKML